MFGTFLGAKVSTILLFGSFFVGHFQSGIWEGLRSPRSALGTGSAILASHFGEGGEGLTGRFRSPRGRTTGGGQTHLTRLMTPRVGGFFPESSIFCVFNVLGPQAG